jgi:type II secretory pathway pseudopilin PulG
MDLKKIKRIHKIFCSRDSFTLTELLVVVGILIILTSVTVLIINPVEYFKQSRDVQRTSDLENIQIAIEKYKYSGGRVGSMGSVGTVYVSMADPSSPACGGLSLPALASGWVYHCVTDPANLQKTDGNGWIPVNISSTGVMSSLPLDPTNSSASNLYYSYAVNSTGQFELTATLESQKKLKDTALTDGGTDPARYETGEIVALWTQASGSEGYWPFDEGSGTTAYDSSGYGNNGTWSGSSPYYDIGKVGPYSANFNGTNDIMSSSQSLDLSGTNKISISIWMKFTTTATDVLFEHSVNDNVNNAFFIATGDGSPAGHIEFCDHSNSAGYNVIYTSNTHNDGHWHNVVITSDRSLNGANQSKIYIDGVDETVNNPNYVSDISENYGTYPLYIGSRSGLIAPFAGQIDDARIYGRILSATEIQNMYNATK